MTIETLKTYALRTVRPHESRDRLLTTYGLFLATLLIALTAIRVAGCGWDGLWVSLIDKLVAGVLLAIIALVWYRLTAPRSGFAEDLEVVEAWNNNPKLRTPLSSTKAYWFRGRSGRWFRNVAIPALSSAASRDQITRTITMILPDPNDRTVLKAYADHRNSLATGGGEHWTPERIRLEILATILVAGQTAACNRLFTTRVFLIPDFSVFRYDLSDAGLMMTREDPRLPGWFSREGTRFFASVREDLRIATERGREVTLSQVQWPQLLIPVADLQSVIEQLGFNFPLSDEEAQALHEVIENKDDPYA
jgi:hypothetical protein